MKRQKIKYYEGISEQIPPQLIYVCELKIVVRIASKDALLQGCVDLIKEFSEGR